MSQWSDSGGLGRLGWFCVPQYKTTVDKSGYFVLAGLCEKSVQGGGSGSGGGDCVVAAGGG